MTRRIAKKIIRRVTAGAELRGGFYWGHTATRLSLVYRAERRMLRYHRRHPVVRTINTMTGGIAFF